MINCPSRHFYLTSLLLLAGLFFGCSNSSTTVNSSSIIVLSRAKGFAHLEAGGLSIRGAGDTAVNFDLVPNLSITNDSNVPLHLFAEWEISTLENINQIVTPPISLLFDTVDLGIVPANSTIALDSIPIVTLSDSFANQQLSYTLWLGTKNSHFSDYAIDVFDSVPFNSRYRGFVYTTESSPTPLDTLDRPDDGDWQGDSIFMPQPAHPNPALVSTFVGFTGPGSFPANPETLDSVRGNLYITPHHFVSMVSDSLLKSGTHTISLNLSGYNPGLYRLIWTAYKGNNIVTSHGDIMVPLH